MRIRLAPHLVGLLTLAACGGPDAPESTAVCSIVRVYGEIDPENPPPQRPVRAREWVDLLLEEGAFFGREIDRDCEGHELVRAPSRTSCDPISPNGLTTAGEPATPVRLSEERIIDNRVSPTERLVWIQTHDLPEGDAFGPVALTETTLRGVDVRSIGHLRAHALNARLRLVPVGRRTALIAEADRCERPGDPSSCHREAMILPEQEGRFVTLPLQLESGGCLGAPGIALDGEKMLPLDNGWQRRFVLSASVGVEGDRVVVIEQVVAHDLDPSSPDTPPRLVRQVDSRRTLQFFRDAIRTDAEPLFERVLETLGDTHLE